MSLQGEGASAAGRPAADLYLGAISGTSIDGLDLALVDAGAVPPRIVNATTTPMPAALATELRALAAPGRNEVERMARADATLGEFIGRAARTFAGKRRIAAIGSHGQTIRHGPRSNPSYTVQIGDPNRIAEVSGMDVVADFRRRDMAAGGEGAPLVPPFHAALFGVADAPRAILNIGGIANVTLLGPPPLVGFDTGPGNALLDAWVRAHRQAPFDRDGAWASQGAALPALLAKLLADPYLEAPPPKSTGKEVYNLGYVQAQLTGNEEAADVQATLAEFTAASVAKAIGCWGNATVEVIVCGGGRLNGDLMARLVRRLAPRPVRAAEAVGVDGDALEAAAFAWLAHCFLRRLPANAPTVTGAGGPRVLGALYPAGQFR